MKQHHLILQGLWDKAVQDRGHTGYSDSIIHKYDQPIRLATVNQILDKIFPKSDFSSINALDIGCGTGDFISLFRNRNATVTGFDISPQVITRARKRFMNDKKVSLLSGPALEIPLPQEHYDVVTSITVLQHILDEEELILSLLVIRKAMKSDGKFIILELSPERTHSVLQSTEGTPYLLERPAEEWRNILNKAGFNIIAEPVMPQLGISMLRYLQSSIAGVSKLIKRNKGQSLPGNDLNDSSKHGSVNEISTLTLETKVISAIRRAVLLLSWPFDYWLHLPLPVKSQRHYHVFVCNIAANN